MIFLWVVQLKVLLVSQQMGAYVVILGHMLQVLNSPMGSLCARTHAAAEASAPYARRKRLRITPAKVGYDIAPTSQIRSCLLALSGRGQMGCDLSLRRPRLGLRLVRALP